MQSSIDDLLLWMYDNLDTLFPTMEWERYSKGWRSHYHADDFTLSSDKRNEWQTSCLEKSHYCCTDVARGTFQLIKMYANYVKKDDKEAVKELFRMKDGEPIDYVFEQYKASLKKEKQEKNVEIVYLSDDLEGTTFFLSQFTPMGNSPFAKYFSNIFSKELVSEASARWYIKEKYIPEGALICYPYINKDGRLVIYKEIPYGTDGHRLHDTRYNSNVQSAKNGRADVDFEKSFFGEHLWDSSKKKIIIVESEKTAFILDLFFSIHKINQDCMILAAGGMQWLNGRLRNSLFKGKHIFLCADLSKDDAKLYDWEINDTLLKIKEEVGIADIQMLDFSQYASADEKKNGADIGDILVRIQQDWNNLASVIMTDADLSNVETYPTLLSDLTVRIENEKKEIRPMLDLEKLTSLSPSLLQDIMALENNPLYKEYLLLASCMSFGQLFDNITFDYGSELDQHLQMNLIIVAKSGSGKGKLSIVRKLLEKVHDRISAGSRIEKEEWLRKRAEGDDTTPPPPNKSLFLPGNTTDAALLNILAENDGRGIMLESELDTINTAMKSKYGGFSATIRNAFNGERLSINRRTDNTLVEIKDPHFSLIASGTYDQVRTFFDGQIQNGLFSRFCFYPIETPREWISPFNTNASSALISSLQERLERLFLSFLTTKATVEITHDQKMEMDSFMKEIFDEYKEFTDKDSDSCIFRMGLIFFRIATVISLLDYEDKPAPTKVTISRNAFEFAKEFVESMLPFTFKMWDFLNSVDEKHVVGKDVLDQLPGKFKTADVIAFKPERTAIRYIKTWEASKLISKVARGEFKKL